jgi:putative endonuclease
MAMAAPKQQIGLQGEAIAVDHLRRMGYKIITRNYRTHLGEIDIVAKHKEAWVFVEVKTRRSQRYGHPKWALTPAKQRQISMVALQYLKQHKAVQSRARFDVVTIQNPQDNPEIEVIANAFELAYP